MKRTRNVTIVLVRAEHPGNVGAVARAMKNFGIHKLILINPQCEWNGEEARRRAKHAGNILNEAKKLSSLDKVTCDTLVATSGKVGTDYNLPRTPLTPKKLAVSAVGHIGLVFGPESSGLRNEEIELCDIFVSIPASEEYPVLNLSHAVSVLAYELATTQANQHRTRATDKEHADDARNKLREDEEEFIPASMQDKKILLQLIDETLSDLSFETKEKRETQEILWKRVLGKAFLTKRESFGLMGYFKKLLGKR